MSEPKTDTTDTVVRYNPLHLSFKAGMKPAFDGVCVLYSDYEVLAAELEKEKQEHAKTLSLANDRDVAAQARIKELEGAYGQERELHASTIRESMKRAARIQELEGWQEEAFRDVIHAKAEANILRLALAEYGHHKGGCDFAPCSCGILAALKEKP